MYYVILEILSEFKNLEAKEKRLIYLAGCGITLLLVYLIWSLFGWVTAPPDPRIRLFGRISYQKTPIDSGSVEFLPIKADEGQTRLAIIREGVFDIPKMEGLQRDMQYQIAVKAFRGTGEYYENNTELDPVEVQEQYLPSKYNTESILTFKSNSNTLGQEFVLDLE